VAPSVDNGGDLVIDDQMAKFRVRRIMRRMTGRLTHKTCTCGCHYAPFDLRWLGPGQAVSPTQCHCGYRGEEEDEGVSRPTWLPTYSKRPMYHELANFGVCRACGVGHTEVCKENGQPLFIPRGGGGEVAGTKAHHVRLDDAAIALGYKRDPS
jgi:hypothetical protein